MLAINQDLHKGNDPAENSQSDKTAYIGHDNRILHSE
jgi:hypothetical protein